jgi:hypothetical protein
MVKSACHLEVRCFAVKPTQVFTPQQSLLSTNKYIFGFQNCEKLRSLASESQIYILAISTGKGFAKIVASSQLLPFES